MARKHYGHFRESAVFYNDMKKFWLVVVFIVLFIIGIGSTAIAYHYYNKTQQMVKNPQAATDMENQAILQKISTIMELPSKKPSIATILDKTKLQGQAFFQKAQNGDKVIIFEQARRVLLYRPDTGRVIDFAPLVFDTQSPTPIMTVTPSEIKTPTPTAASRVATASSSRTKLGY